MVSGDVKNPGRVSMLEDVSHRRRCHQQAGGPSRSPTGSGANQLQVVVRRKGQVI
jgi:polysaccharide export outer membrane protein